MISTTHTSDENINRKTEERKQGRTARVNKESCSRGGDATATVDKKLGAVHYGRLGGSRLNM